MPPIFLVSPWGALFWTFAITLALSVHECMHAAVAVALGDKTPKKDGRVTLNPYPHLDPLGFVLFLTSGAGWGKPVRFYPDQLGRHKYGRTMVALAGPLSNLCIVLVAALLSRAALGLGLRDSVTVTVFFQTIIVANGLLAVVNVVPLPPFDGSKLLRDALENARAKKAVELFDAYGVYATAFLMFVDTFYGPHVVQTMLQMFLSWTAVITG